MNYKIVIEKPAMKFLAKQPQAQRERLLKAINRLPGMGDIKAMQGYENRYRLRVGSYRVIYSSFRKRCAPLPYEYHYITIAL